MRAARVTAIFGAVGLVVGLAACGGSDGGSSGGGGGGGSSSAKYCDVAKELEASTDKFSDISDDPADMKSVVELITAGIKKAEEVAPAEIKPAISTLSDGFQQLKALFEKNDYDLTKIAADPEFETISNDQTFTDASNAVDAYNEKECGITSSTDTTGG
jgi:hypothetical protein